MIESYFYNSGGFIIPVLDNSFVKRWDAIEYCLLCQSGDRPKHGPPVCDIPNNCAGCTFTSLSEQGLFDRLNHWILRCGPFCEVNEQYRNKSTPALGRILFCNNQYVQDASLQIDRLTIRGWCKNTRDPLNRRNDESSRENIYRLSFLLGLYSNNSINDLFVWVLHGLAFTKANSFECCVEHYAVRKDRSWLPHAIEINDMILAGNCADNEAEDDDDEEFIQIVSAIGNTCINDAEFVSIMKKANGEYHAEARSIIENLGRKAWLYINNCKKDQLPAEWTLKNKKIIGQIIGRAAKWKNDSKKMLSAERRKEIKIMGVVRNFPSAGILNSICSGEANGEETRRMLIFLALYVFDCETRTKSFPDYCNEFLDRAGFSHLDVNDGYDAMMVFCGSTLMPAESLRRLILHFMG